MSIKVAGNFESNSPHMILADANSIRGIKAVDTYNDLLNLPKNILSNTLKYQNYEDAIGQVWLVRNYNGHQELFKLNDSVSRTGHLCRFAWTRVKQLEGEEFEELASKVDGIDGCVNFIKDEIENLNVRTVFDKSTTTSSFNVYNDNEKAVASLANLVGKQFNGPDYELDSNESFNIKWPDSCYYTRTVTLGIPELELGTLIIPNETSNFKIPLTNQNCSKSSTALQNRCDNFKIEKSFSFNQPYIDNSAYGEPTEFLYELNRKAAQYTYLSTDLISTVKELTNQDASVYTPILTAMSKKEILERDHLNYRYNIPNTGRFSRIHDLFTVDGNGFCINNVITPSYDSCINGKDYFSIQSSNTRFVDDVDPNTGLITKRYVHDGSAGFIKIFGHTESNFDCIDRYSVLNADNEIGLKIDWLEGINFFGSPVSVDKPGTAFNNLATYGQLELATDFEIENGSLLLPSPYIFNDAQANSVSNNYNASVFSFDIKTFYPGYSENGPNCFYNRHVYTNSFAQNGAEQIKQLHVKVAATSGNANIFVNLFYKSSENSDWEYLDSSTNSITVAFESTPSSYKTFYFDNAIIHKDWFTVAAVFASKASNDFNERLNVRFRVMAIKQSDIANTLNGNIVTATVPANWPETGPFTYFPHAAIDIGYASPISSMFYKKALPEKKYGRIPSLYSNNTWKCRNTFEYFSTFASDVCFTSACSTVYFASPPVINASYESYSNYAEADLNLRAANVDYVNKSQPVVVLTRAEYDALGSIDPNKVYIIKDEYAPDGKYTVANPDITISNNTATWTMVNPFNTANIVFNIYQLGAYTNLEPLVNITNTHITVNFIGDLASVENGIIAANSYRLVVIC